MIIRLFSFLLVLFTSVNAFSLDEPVLSGDTAFVPNDKPVFYTKKISKDRIKIDGNLNEPEWLSIGPANNFSEVEPGDNIPAPVKTEAFSLYDEDNVYFAIVCYDDEMSKLRVNMADRDNAFSGDFCGVIIDTYQDEKQAIELWSNAYGIQGDAITANGNENFSFDMVYYCEAKIYKDRWVVEFAVPIKNMRFPDKVEQDWNIHFWRVRPRENRTEISWAKISRDVSSWLGQMGTMKGLKNLKKGSNFEILPYVIGTKSDTLIKNSDPLSGLVNDRLKGDFGVNVKYGFSSNLTGELSYNPDFSQVESDATQIDVNSNSALFFPEKRPFFLEGSDIFETLINTIYTRSINDPIVLGKLIGKVGKFDVGFMTGLDENTPFLIPYQGGSQFIVADSLKSYSSILRLKHNFKGEDFLGFAGTSREFRGGAYNRVLGFDGSFKFFNDLYFKFQALGYFTKELNDSTVYYNPERFGKDNQYTLTFDGESFFGLGADLMIQKQGRFWSGGIEYFQNPPETRRDLGFVSTADFRQLFTWHNFSIYPKSGIIVRLQPAFDGGMQYDYKGIMREQWLVPNLFIQFKKLINMNAGFLAVNNENYNGAELRNVHRGWGSLNINTSNKVRGGIFYETGKYIIRFAYPSYAGWGVSANVWLTLNLFNRLSLENNWDYFELSKEHGGEKLFTGYVLRSKASFQFTKKFFLRLVAEYSSFGDEFSIDPLLSYKWNPFTIFYIGSSHRLLNTEDVNRPGSKKLAQTNRQIFAKFQYLFTL